LDQTYVLPLYIRKRISSKLVSSTSLKNYTLLKNVDFRFRMLTFHGVNLEAASININNAKIKIIL